MKFTVFPDFTAYPARVLKGLALLAGGALLVWAAAPAPAALSQSPSFSTRPAPDLEIGKQAYLDNCARCHGVTGAGDGRDSARMLPKPRRLSEGVFKFRTTASGTPPTDEDLFHTLTEGLPGSRMPEFQRLPEETRWQLVYYVKSLSPIFADQKPELIPLGKDPGPKKTNEAHGKELYTQLGCSACHGALGRADGPSSPTLVDQWGEPIRAADLTQGWTYRSGSSPKDILTRLITGLDGTPMPSYAEAVKPEEVWDLAYYVHSIQEKPRWSRVITASAAAGPLPSSPADPQWDAAPRHDLRLASSYYQDGKLLPTTVTSVSVRAIQADGQIALRLSWHDPREDKGNPPDAAALVVLPDRRLKWTLGSLRAWPAAKGLPEPEVLSWSADQKSEAQSSFSEGEWAVVLKRPLPSSKEPIRFGILVWDGGNGETGRRRANSNWVDLVLK